MATRMGKEFRKRIKQDGLAGAAKFVGEKVEDPQTETYRIGKDGEKIKDEKAWVPEK